MERQTPYYVINQKELDDNFGKLKKALDDHWENNIIGYSYKTNALPWIVSHFDALGCYAEVVSEDEYNLAKRMGVAKDRIIYNGPIKTKGSFLEAVSNGCIVNVDSQRELDWIGEIATDAGKIGLRVNFDIEKMCPGQSQCGDEGGRFGFCFENGEFEKALHKVQRQGCRVAGLHLHTSSKSRGLDIYRAIAEMACQITETYDLQLDYVDVGGGFFGGLPTKPQFDEYMALMAGILKRTFSPEKTALIVEPGMAVIGAPVSYVTSVIDVKDTISNRFVMIDGSRTNIDPFMTKSNYFRHIHYKSEKESLPKQVISGYTCMEHDRLYTAVNEPELSVGDQIVFEKVGAYTMCLTPLFIRYFPDVYVYDGQQMRKVRNAWTAEEYVQKSLWDKE